MFACENKKVLSWSFGWFVGHFGGVLDVVAVLVVLVILSIVRSVVLLLGRFGRFVVSVVLVVLVVWFWSFGLLLFVLLLCGRFVCYVCWTLLSVYRCSRYGIYIVLHCTVCIWFLNLLRGGATFLFHWNQTQSVKRLMSCGI